MNKRYSPIIGAAALGAVAILTLAACGGPDKPKGAVAVRPFDANRYMGRWYEVARLDFKYERDLNNTTADYSLIGDGSIRVLNKGYNYKTGEWKEAKGKARFRGDKDLAELKVSFFGPFYSGYNVIALDTGYQYALVAGESLKYLWLLSREPRMPQSVKQDYLRKAGALGYDTSALVWVAHDTEAR